MKTISNVLFININKIKKTSIILLISCLLFLLFMLIIENRSDEFENDLKVFQPEHCGCKRRLPTSSQSDQILFNDTTCSMDSYRRGSGQRVIAYTYFGSLDSDDNKQKGFFVGIRDNLKEMQLFFPNWLMRLYIDLDKADPMFKSLCDLACENQFLDLCFVASLPGNPMTDARKMFPRDWRYLPTLDPQVDVFLSRDLDSRFSEREVAAVDEWINSDKPLHIMRDHPHHDAPILGGTWGTDLTKKNCRELWKNSWTKILKDPLTWESRSIKSADQDMLTKFIWKDWGRGMSFQHDSFLCKKYPGSIGFPTQRLPGVNNFVGAVVNENLTIETSCPMKCRRDKEWEFC